MNHNDHPETAICAECENYVPTTKIVAWRNPEENIGVCWECYGGQA